jgi:tetratricopeptide (TPR) repeat protein
MKIIRVRPFSRRASFLLRGLFCICLATVAATAVVRAEDVQRADSGEARQLARQGEKAIRKGDLVSAEKLFLRAIDLDPANAENRGRLAYVYLKLRNLRKAYEISFALAKADSKNANAFALLGGTLLAAGKFDDARKMFVNSIGLNKRESLAWAGIGMLDFYENRIQDSLDNLSEAVFYDDEPDYVFALAQVAARAEKYNVAADAYDHFLMISRNTDDERRDRIKGLINFLRFLGQKQSLYAISGDDQTTVPVRLQVNRPVITLRVNDGQKPLNFVLDTGSGISVLSDVTAKRLKINPIARGGFAKGIGGDGRFEIVYGFVREFEIGGVQIRNVPVYIRKFHTEDDTVDGYIGLSLISKFLTTIDYGSQTFTLAKRADPAEPINEGSSTLPLRLTSSGFLSGEVQLEGLEEPLNFIVDTGATVSVISNEVASTKSISAFAREERMRVIGSAGVTEDVPSFLLPKVSFGSHSRNSITAISLNLGMINEASGFEQAGILGGNFLRNYRMTFDFKNSRVTFVPVKAEK